MSGLCLDEFLQLTSSKKPSVPLTLLALTNPGILAGEGWVQYGTDHGTCFNMGSVRIFQVRRMCVLAGAEHHLYRSGTMTADRLAHHAGPSSAILFCAYFLFTLAAVALVGSLQGLGDGLRVFPHLVQSAFHGAGFVL